MASIVVSVQPEDLALYKQMLDECPDLVDVVKEQAPKESCPPLYPTLFTLDAGIGNSINYYYLGREWERRQQWERQQREGGQAA